MVRLEADIDCGMLHQVTIALNEAESARHEVPYALIQHLVQAPAALDALHKSLAADAGMNYILRLHNATLQLEKPLQRNCSARALMAIL